MVNVRRGDKIGEGSYKKAYKVEKISEKSSENPDFAVAYGRNKIKKFEDKYLILQYKGSEREKIFQELELYNKFSQLGISPKILYVSWNNGEEIIQSSLNWFLTYYAKQEFSTTIKLLMEKADCGKNIFDYYVGDHDYTKFFGDLRNFITEKIVGNGYVNTDIKPENLCIDPDTGDMLMIDLDPEFMKPINPAIYDDIYVDYMLFQVFVVMVKHNKKNVKFENFFRQKQIVNVLYELINNFTDLNRHPLRSLIHYSGVNHTFNVVLTNYHRLNNIGFGYMFLTKLLNDILHNIGIVSVHQDDVEEPSASLSENNVQNNNVQNYNPPTYSPERAGFGNWFPRGGNKSKGNKKKKNSRKRKTHKAHK